MLPARIPSYSTPLPIMFAAALLLLLSACNPGEPQATSQQPASQAAETTDAVATSAPDAAEAKRPNIVYILADDLGYSDLSILGSEIPTPNLDQLANDGMLLTQFYTSLTCSPTRSMIMSGTDNHVAGVGVQGRPSREEHLNQPGYAGYLNFEVASLPELLSDAGYNTYMTGKWHLGNTVETGPAARGFKHVFASLDGGAHLSGLDWSAPVPAEYRDDNELVHIEDEDFYTTEFFTRRMIDYIEADRDEGKPFFAWLAYTAPHWPLQAPEASIERFRGWYDEGWEVIHHRRLERMGELGLLPENFTFPDASIWTDRWDSLDAEEQRFATRRMEIYAAMVSDLDRYVGEFVDYLKSIGEYENTLIIFSSDNGAESNRLDLSPGIGQYIGNGFDNSFDNLGKGDSYVMYGRDWATVSGGPFRRHKATAFEGGIRVPAFAHFPGVIAPQSRSDALGTVMDLLPTFLDVADWQHPGSEYRGHSVKPPQGRSLLPLFRGETRQIHDNNYVGWELFGHRSIRQGDWKIVWDRTQGENTRWQLFNLAEDAMETTDLADSNPEQLAEMLRFWDRYVEDSGVIY